LQCDDGKTIGNVRERKKVNYHGPGMIVRTTKENFIFRSVNAIPLTGKELGRSHFSRIFSVLFCIAVKI
jgi:hypothetical protein